MNNDDKTLEITDRDYELICWCVDQKLAMCDLEINQFLMFGRTEKDLDFYGKLLNYKRELTQLQKKLEEMKK